jgi:hypothetical protein
MMNLKATMTELELIKQGKIYDSSLGKLESNILENNYARKIVCYQLVGVILALLERFRPELNQFTCLRDSEEVLPLS